jgi:hypothetical protein
MNRLRRHPLFFATIIGCGLLGLGEIGWLAAQVRAADRATRQLQLRRREANALVASAPPPTAANAALIESGLAAARRTRDALRAGLAGPPENADSRPPSTRPADAYFELAGYVERMRAHAQRAGVRLEAGEHFGFSDYARSGPGPDSIMAVHRERLAAERLLETLFAARPSRLLSVQREAPPLAEVASGARSDGNGSLDTFDFPAWLTVRVPGLVNATGFRISFTGTTAVLRDWLNRLVASEATFVVRSVEVDRAQDPEEAALPSADSSRPWVRHADSRFTVTLEQIELAPPPAAPDA